MGGWLDLRETTLQLDAIRNTPSRNGIKTRAGFVSFAGLRMRGIVAHRDIARCRFADGRVALALIQQRSEETLLFCPLEAPQPCGRSACSHQRRRRAGASVGGIFPREDQIIVRRTGEGSDVRRHFRPTIAPAFSDLTLTACHCGRGNSVLPPPPVCATAACARCGALPPGHLFHLIARASQASFLPRSRALGLELGKSIWYLPSLI